MEPLAPVLVAREPLVHVDVAPVDPEEQLRWTYARGFRRVPAVGREVWSVEDPEAFVALHEGFRDEVLRRRPGSRAAPVGRRPLRVSSRRHGRRGIAGPTGSMSRQ